MPTPIHAIAALTRKLQERLALEKSQQLVVDAAAELLETPRASLRLLDPSRTRLIATARAGKPLHLNPAAEYQLGEGLIGWIAQNGQPIRAGDAESDARFVRRPDMVQRMGSFLGVPLLGSETCIGVLAAVTSERDYFTEEHEALMVLLAGVSVPFLEVERLARLAQIDPLTGALNRRGLELAFPDAAKISPRSVALLDVDHLSALNERYGQPFGDEVLRRIAQVLATELRPEDAVVRYGGEEFLVILPALSAKAALAELERVRAAVEKVEIRHRDAVAKVTVSAGLAQQRAGETREDTIVRANAALTEAKRGGRNKIVSG